MAVGAIHELLPRVAEVRVLSVAVSLEYRALSTGLF
jgi:hypothetical protein